MLVAGLMSGTSMDGIDAALLWTDGDRTVKPLHHLTIPYEVGLRAAIRAVLGGSGDVPPVERALTLAHAEAVRRLLATAEMTSDQVVAIGFHGHTILHRPQEGRTWQIGDGHLLARMTGVPCVHDFRMADMRAGGQGAPLAPVYHQALLPRGEEPVAVLNIGGVANLTWWGADGCLIAFDTGPGNALIDDWLLRMTGTPMDRNGALATRGRVDEACLERLMAHPYFGAPTPKSLDRIDFDISAIGDLNAADGAATLTAFTAAAVAVSRVHLPAAPATWYVTGGGRHNATLMEMLRERLGVPVHPVEVLGWDGDALEAQAFAYLAVRHLRGLPNSFPGTTGCAEPTIGGVLIEPEAEPA